MENLSKSWVNGVRINKLRTSEFFLCVQYFLYFVTLLLVYVNGIAPTYAYMGFVDAFSEDNLLISLAFLFFSMPFIRPNGRPSGFFLTLAASVVLVPSLVLYTGAGLSHRFALLTVAAIWLVSITARIVKLKPVSVPTPSRPSLLLLFGLIAVSTIGIIFAFGGGRHFNLNLSAVYDLRREAAAVLPGISGYLNSVTSKVVIPFAMVFAAQRRNWSAVFLLALLSVLMFALTAHKSPLFFPLVVGFAYLVAGRRHLHHIFLAGLTAILVVSAVDLWAQRVAFGDAAGWLSSLLVRRALLVPSLLNWFYLDYFLDAPKYLWADSKFSLGLVESPYALRSVNLIALEYFGREEMSANTGWIGSGYANAGIGGLLLYSVMIGALFSLLDAYALRIGNRMIIALFILPVFILLTSSDLTTMILTHGLLLSIFFLTIIRPDARQKKEQL
jgi:hypothetical protein